MSSDFILQSLSNIDVKAERGNKNEPVNNDGVLRLIKPDDVGMAKNEFRNWFCPLDRGTLRHLSS